jgi:maleylpyruvate isomerase
MDEDAAVALTTAERSDAVGRRVLADVVRLRGVLEPVLARLTDADVAAPSRLPGWTRGHVLAHLAGVGAGAARQVEHGRARRLVDFYDGGRPARDAAIEAGAGAPAGAHARDVLATALRVESALASLGAEDWDAPTRYRDQPVTAVAHAWWRELAIHLVDLDLGVGTGLWTSPLLDHLVEFLAPRVPRGRLVALVPGGGASRWEVGDGVLVRVHADRAEDLVAWLAGREPGGRVTAESDGQAVSLPELGPWP